MEDKLRDDRVAIYNDVLEPFVLMSVSDEAWKSDPKNKKKDKGRIIEQKYLSVEYRRRAFQMTLMGGDGVVLAYNALMQHFFSREHGADDFGQIGPLLGHFLLEIRRSMGNEETQLDEWKMLEWFITDGHKYRG